MRGGATVLRKTSLLVMIRYTKKSPIIQREYGTNVRSRFLSSDENPTFNQTTDCVTIGKEEGWSIEHIFLERQGKVERATKEGLRPKPIAKTNLRSVFLSQPALIKMQMDSRGNKRKHSAPLESQVVRPYGAFFRSAVAASGFPLTDTATFHVPVSASLGRANIGSPLLQSSTVRGMEAAAPVGSIS